MPVRDDFTSLCHNLLSYQLRFPTFVAVNLQFLPKSQSQSTSTVFQLASRSFYSLCYCIFWSISSAFTNRNKQLFFKMTVGFTISTEKICTHWQFAAVESCYHKLTASEKEKKRKLTTTTTKKEQQQNKKKKMCFVPGKKSFCHHSFCKAILYYFRY